MFSKYMGHVQCVAEIAQAHDGSLGILHSFIDALAETGVDAVKFQMHIASAESSSHEPFRVKFSYEDETRYDYWERMELTPEQWAGVKLHCESKNVEFLVTPFSLRAVELLERLEVKRYKVGSGDLLTLPLLDAICQTRKDVILSSGMAGMDDIEVACTFVKKNGNHITLLQCTSEYPTPPEKVGLQTIPTLRQRFQVPVGLSDHSGTPFPCLAAVALGASFLEFHAAFSRQMFGPDAKASLEIDEIAAMVKGVRFLEKAMSGPSEKLRRSEQDETRKMFGRSLATAKALLSGSILQLNDLEVKKPAGVGIHASDYSQVIGRSLKVAKSAGDFIDWSDLE